MPRALAAGFRRAGFNNLIVWLALLPAYEKEFVVSKRGFQRLRVLLCTGAVLAGGGAPTLAQAADWRLQSTAQRVLQVAPERAAAEAEVKARQGRLGQAGAWPNPTIALGASNAMGKDDGQGGTALNLLSITQPLPLSGRLDLQRQQAGASLRQAEANVSQQRLLLEYEAARIFHSLQFSRARLQLARQRLESADEFQHIGQRREAAGDLSRLARLRLDLVRESAKQEIATAEGRVGEALSDFQTLLNMEEAAPAVASLDHFPPLPPLDEMLTRLEAHPALVAARQGVEAARQGVAVARADRFADPEVWLAQERDVLGDRRQTATAFGVTLTVPLWNRGKGNIDAARANRQKAQFEVDALLRQLGNRLRLNHRHLSHLIEQGHDFRTHVLVPAEEIFRLSRKGFVAGQVDILNLVDAVESYFNARGRYLELLQAAWMEAAALRRTAGLSLLNEQGTAQ